jgi:signal transduction histidine kinase
MAIAVREAQLRSSSEGFNDDHSGLVRDVHDVVGNAMTAIHLQAQLALRALAQRPEEAAEALRSITIASQRSLQELRIILSGAEGRRPGNASLAHLDALVAVTTASRVRVDLEVVGDVERVPAAHDEAAYRIVQESLTNAIRHGHATRLHIRLEIQPGALTLEVIDNGRGAVPQVRPLPGRGIRGMRERAALLDGALSAGPTPGTGFSVRARLPLPNPIHVGSNDG